MVIRMSYIVISTLILISCLTTTAIKKDVNQLMKGRIIAGKSNVAFKEEKQQKASNVSTSLTDLLGKDYNKSPNLTAVKKKIYEHLGKIANLCHQKSIEQQVKQLNHSLAALRKMILFNLEKSYLDIKDKIFIEDVYNLVVKEGVLTAQKNITVQLVKNTQISLAGNFLHNYQAGYNMDEIEEDDDDVDHTNRSIFLHDWAPGVYQGLQCVK